MTKPVDRMTRDTKRIFSDIHWVSFVGLAFFAPAKFSSYLFAIALNKRQNIFVSRILLKYSESLIKNDGDTQAYVRMRI